ncbi:colicin V production protein CvpA [Candidatus Kinetoplastibacterium oncopeltii TCC290E]|uniref:Colicin V production protein CvpA n=1 Tax=Candidatus Kinetoplastidibacterium stringomonadis TCC290E TaxID=1208920 RepID=M1LYV4_9PROT|nr:CvpA family protein [Candidatus Kinetoplastibacterium oncopeltii]AGF48314.1 colicin V production protein CvpA [Candidatus Kinetoplastibacterium oncopeltii TCC290E]
MNLFDYILTGVLLVSCITGYFRGFVRELFSFFSYFISFLLTILFAPDVNYFIERYIDSQLISICLSYLVVFFSVLLACSFINILISFFVVKTGMSSIDRALGVVFGVLRGLLLILLFLLCCSMLSTEYWFMDSVLVKPAMDLVYKIREFLLSEI